jgi:hypothetical protein
MFDLYKAWLVDTQYERELDNYYSCYNHKDSYVLSADIFRTIFRFSDVLLLVSFNLHQQNLHG